MTIEVVEGIHGTWHYHLRDTDSNDREKYNKFMASLCGRDVMRCNLPIKAWGTVTHLKERYCEQCWKIYQSQESLKNDSKNGS